jgi:uncharacterized protein YkwD
MSPAKPMRRRRAVILFVGAGLLSLAASAMPLVSAEAALLALINDARSDLGSNALRLNERMRDAALAASQDMATHGTLSTVGSDGKTLFDRLDDAGYSAAPFQPGGVVGGGTASASALTMVELWLADPFSRPMLTAAGATEIGVGLAFDASERAYWSVLVNPVAPVSSTPGGGGQPTPPGLNPSACDSGLALLGRAACLLNDLRLRQGLQGWTLDDRLTTVGTAHSLDMLTNDFVGAAGSDGSFFAQRLDEAGYTGDGLGQLVAGGFDSIDAVLAAWLGDDGSRDVLLNPRADEFGLGLQGAGRDSRWTLLTGQAGDAALTVPEPAALLLTLSALLALGLATLTRRRRPIFCSILTLRT